MTHFSHGLALGAANRGGPQHPSARFHLPVSQGYPEKEKQVWMDTANSCPWPQVLLNSDYTKPSSCCHCTLITHPATGVRILKVQLALTDAVSISVPSIYCAFVHSWHLTSLTPALCGTASFWHWGEGITHAAAVHFADVITAQSLSFFHYSDLLKNVFQDV